MWAKKGVATWKWMLRHGLVFRGLRPRFGVATRPGRGRVKAIVTETWCRDQARQARSPGAQRCNRACDTALRDSVRSAPAL